MMPLFLAATGDCDPGNCDMGKVEQNDGKLNASFPRVSTQLHFVKETEAMHSQSRYVSSWL